MTAAGLENALHLAGKKLEDVKLICNGAGSAAIACLNLLCAMGLKKENILVFDSKGLISEDRIDQLDEYKGAFASRRSVKNLEEAMNGADIFLGLSVKNVVTRQTALYLYPDQDPDHSIQHWAVPYCPKCE